jgi:hypothetical protein
LEYWDIVGAENSFQIGDRKRFLNFAACEIRPLDGDAGSHFAEEREPFQELAETDVEAVSSAAIVGPA